MKVYTKKVFDQSKTKGKMVDSKQQTNKIKHKTKKKKRIIIRNLSFKVNEEDLKNVFAKYGNIVDVKIPLKTDGKKRGFGFVEFADTKSLIKAMKEMNYKEIQGRKIAIDFAVDKTSYQLKVQSLKEEKKDSPANKKTIKTEPDIDIKSEEDSDVEGSDKDEDNESEDEEEKRLNAFLKEFDSGAEALTNSNMEDDSAAKSSSSESSGDDSDEEDGDKGFGSDDEVKQEAKGSLKSQSEKPQVKKRDSKDVSEGKTVFLRNVSFTTCEESLQEGMEEYGECEYCLLCMDQLTDHPKGTAFVKFKEKSSADKLVEASYIEPGVVVDGRKLTCTYAISREDASHMKEPSKEKKDKRNLNLLRVGLIMPDSEEAQGMSKTDMATRSRLEAVKKQKLRNVNFFVSDKRLVIHNLPHAYTDKQLRQLFKKAAGSGAVVTEARVMKEFKRTDAQGLPLSKGFGFVSFEKPEHALKALNELNNNSQIFTPQKRPIVEFSVENKVALLSKERKKEKIQMRNKRRTEEKKLKLLNQAPSNDDKAPSKTANKGQKRKQKNEQLQNIKKQKEDFKHDNNILKEGESPKKSRKKNKQKRNRSKNGDKNVNSFNQDSVSDLKRKYIDKLSNKI